MKTGDKHAMTYGGAKVSGKIVHIEGLNAVLKVEKSDNHDVVRPGQTLIVSRPVSK